MTPPLQLVLASANPNKIREIQHLLPSGIRLLSLKDIGCEEDIPETAPTIEGNALQKANYVEEKYHFDCMADDTGLEVEALGGAPGVLSARYAGEQKDNEANIDKLLEEMRGQKNRKARFKTVISLIFNEETHLFTGICEGEILSSRKGENGFGYDAVFRPSGHSRTFAEMSETEKSDLSHRGKAIKQLIDFLHHRGM